MRNSKLLLLLVPVILIGYMATWKNLSAKRTELLDTSITDYTLPSQFTGPASLEFKGIVSDFLFLKLLTFTGEKIEKRERLSSNYPRYLYESAEAITNLDPWFWDPYLFANALLTWDLGRVDLANKLMEKAALYRPDDYRPPYYLGFNYYFFKKDNDKASKYLIKACKLPGAPEHISFLASRLSVYSLNHKPAILFLKDMLDKTQNAQMAKMLRMRIRTLIILDRLETRLEDYFKTFGKYPSKLSDLVKTGIIDEIPQDPYGGKFYLLPSNRVYTTSKMIYKKQSK